MVRTDKRKRAYHRIEHNRVMVNMLQLRRMELMLYFLSFISVASSIWNKILGLEQLQRCVLLNCFSD